MKTLTDIASSIKSALETKPNNNDVLKIVPQTLSTNQKQQVEQNLSDVFLSKNNLQTIEFKDDQSVLISEPIGPDQYGYLILGTDKDVLAPNSCSIMMAKKQATDKGFLNLRSVDDQGVKTDFFIKPQDKKCFINEKEVDAIDSCGEGYIRYVNGIQILWGILGGFKTENFGSTIIGPGVNTYWSESFLNFARPFKDDNISISVTSIDSYTGMGFATVESWSNTSAKIEITTGQHNSGTYRAFYYVVGMWK